ncbi:MAG TPA: response regulator transcription factor [Bacteroidota bacterium]|nr:response regulator transcription factor [Bacteroidota bacterium]
MISGKITLLVADDHTIVRRGLVSLLSLNPELSIVGEAGDGREAVDLAVKLDPDVVLLDIGMPVLNGFEAAKQIRRKVPHAKILALSAFDNDEYVLEVVHSGANGYILKNTTADELSEAIRSVHNGRSYFSSSVSRALFEEYLKNENPTKNGDDTRLVPRSPLTTREREILQLIAEGETHTQVAEQLHISVRTVDTHCNNIMKKLDIHDRSGLVTYAIKNGIVIIPR